jgi:hypothetical protein
MIAVRYPETSWKYKPKGQRSSIDQEKMVKGRLRPEQVTMDKPWNKKDNIWKEEVTDHHYKVMNHYFWTILCSILWFPPDVTQVATSKGNFVMKLPYLAQFCIGN